ncbi:hypothetical protein L208DRAFT_1404307 [Tricholoma matsutake]|nr:hypothetical protein L208DRAFT_1404307 [Tricholoma matsutake 945]
MPTVKHLFFVRPHGFAKTGKLLSRFGDGTEPFLPSSENADTSSDRYLIWIGSDQEETFGPTISGLIHKNLGPERGRPDVMKLIKDVYSSWGAEVVFITSNFQGNEEMMQGCKEAGIPAFMNHGRYSSVGLTSATRATLESGDFLDPTFG